LQKATYKPTNQKVIILSQFDNYCEIFIDSQEKNVPIDDLVFDDVLNVHIDSIDNLKKAIFVNISRSPITDILYSFNTNKLVPEPHQYKPLIKFLNSENNRILIADEVGLGKTIEAGMIYKEISKREELKISLIVVPSSLTYKWKEELIVRFDEEFEIYKTKQFLHFIDDYTTYSDTKLIHKKLIISYHTLRDEQVMKKLKNSLFEIDFLIMDEAHSMRNITTSTFDSAKLITSLSEHIVFLSATPIQNSLYDLFNILSLLDDDYFKDFDYFQKMIQPNPTIHKLITMLRNNYSLSDIKEYLSLLDISIYPLEMIEIMQEIESLSHLNNNNKIDLIDRLMATDHLNFIINRTKKKDVGLIIPRIAKSKVVEITDDEKVYYQAVIDFVKFINPQVPQGFITIMPERMASSSMIASLETFKSIRKNKKIFIKDIDEIEDYYDDMDIEETALQYLDSIIEKGNAIGTFDSKFIEFEKILQDLKSQNIKQMIVFSFFKRTLDYLENKLIELGYSVGKIYGDFSVEERFDTIKRFKNGIFDILLSSEVGSEGLDMQFCNVVINYDLPWNPMRVEQRIGRIDRIGQKFDKLYIFNLCIIDSIEDRIFNRLYQKLNIFENSIGELEPILGDFEKTIDIVSMMYLSQEEIDQKLHLQELALERKRVEISKHSKEFDKMLNEDLNYKEKEERLLNSLKINILQEQSKQILVSYLNDNNINFLELKDGNIKLSSENLKQLFNILKQNMSDKRVEALKYKEERAVLQKIYKYKELKISFTTNNSNEFQTLYLYLNHPIISIIIRDKNYKTVYSVVSHKQYNNSFAIIYRVDFRQLKERSMIRVLIVDTNLDLVDELDYFEFIHNCRETKAKPNINLEALKAKLNSKVIEAIEQHKLIESASQNRLIDIKINSIENYFEKQINKVQRLQKKVQQEDIQRMRIGEIENLKNQKDKKIKELESQKEISSSFEILGIVGIV